MKRFVVGFLLASFFVIQSAYAQLISAPYNVFDYPAGSKVKVVSILMDYTDATSAASESAVISLVTNENSSLRTHIRGISFNHLDIDADVDKDGQPDIFRLNMGTTATVCDSVLIAAAVRKFVTKGYTIPDPYDKYIMFLPRQLPCGSSGFGAGNTAYILDPSSRVVNHEFGHTLGSSHAGIDSNNDGIVEIEYGDPTCVMGRHYESLGATNLLKSNVLNSTNGLLKQYNNESYVDLRGMYGPFAEGGTRLLKVAIPLFDDWQSNDYLAVFRTPEGIDSRLPTDLYRVQISRFKQKPYYREVMTTSAAYIKSLGVGEVFDDPKTGTRIKFVSMSADMKSARIVVERYQAGTCVRSAPTMSAIAVPQFAAIGLPQYFQATITNNDNSVCNGRSFLVKSQADSGLSVSLTSSGVSVAPGSSAVVSGTVTLSIAGTLNFSVTASDALNSVSSSAQIGVDSVAPSIPGAPVITAVSRKGVVSLQWGASSDAQSGMSYYELHVSVNGSAPVVAGTSSSNSINYTPSVSGLHVFSIRAVDQAGNKSALSSSVSRDIVVSVKGRRK